MNQVIDKKYQRRTTLLLSLTFGVELSPTEPVHARCR